jgi:hypothetical protein
MRSEFCHEIFHKKWSGLAIYLQNFVILVLGEVASLVAISFHSPTHRPPTHPAVNHSAICPPMRLKMNSANTDAQHNSYSLLKKKLPQHFPL